MKDREKLARIKVILKYMEAVNDTSELHEKLKLKKEKMESNLVSLKIIH